MLRIGAGFYEGCAQLRHREALFNVYRVKVVGWRYVVISFLDLVGTPIEEALDITAQHFYWMARKAQPDKVA